MIFTYNLTPRSVEVGGGWRLHLIENGTDVGGGVFLPVSGTASGNKSLPWASDNDVFDTAFVHADAQAKRWLREHKLTKKNCAKAYEIEATRSGWKGRLYKDGDVHAVVSGGPDSYEVVLQQTSEFCDN